MGRVEDGTWAYLRERGLWHFDPQLSEPSDSHGVIGRLMGDCSRLWADVPPGQPKTLGSSMQHRTTDSYYERIQRGNEQDAREYGFAADQIYADVFDAKRSQDSVTLIDSLVNLVPLDGAYWKVHRQGPGQLWPVHVDNYHALAAGGQRAAEWRDPGVRRILIMLTPWSWGQAFFVGNRVWSHWSPGEILFMDWLVPHGSANCGHEVRISLVITGYVTEEFQSWVNGDPREIDIPQ